jgi:hypothetical protein
MKKLIYFLFLATALFSCTKEEFMYEDPEMSFTSSDPIDYSNSKFQLFDTIRYANGYSWTALTPYQGGITPGEVKIGISVLTDAGYYFHVDGTFDTIWSIGKYGNYEQDSAVDINANISYKGYSFVHRITAIFVGTGTTGFYDGIENDTWPEVILWLPGCIDPDYTADTVCFDFNEIQLYGTNAESETF